MTCFLNKTDDGEISNPYRVFFHTQGVSKKLYYVPIIPRVGEEVHFSGQKYTVIKITHTYIINEAPSDFQTDINVYLSKLGNDKEDMSGAAQMPDWQYYTTDVDVD